MHYITDVEGKKRKAVELTCDNCNDVFLRATRLVRESKHTFCSRECYSSFYNESIKCDYCDRTFKRQRSNIKEGFNFCCRECKDRAQQIGSGKKFDSLRPPHYKSGRYVYRKKALAFYGRECNRCNYNESMHAIVVHHIDRNRDNCNMQNLEVLCRNCHAIEHSTDGR